MNLLASRLRVIPPSEHRMMPWRNGFGMTAQIAVDPPEADIGRDYFRWRASVARVDAASPFSRFGGYDRILIVLEGRGLKLTRPSGEVRELGPLQPFVFPGEEDVSAELMEGPVRDFNVMAHRERVRTEVSLLNLEADHPVSLHITFDVTLVYVVQGTAEATLTATGGLHDGPHPVTAAHTFRVDRARGERYEPELKIAGQGLAIVTQFFYLQ